MIAIKTIALCGALLFLLAGCGKDDGGQSQPANGSETEPRIERVEVSREEAVAIAEAEFARDGELATAVEKPHDIVSRLMRVRDVHVPNGAGPLVLSSGDDQDFAWIVQTEGVSHTLDSHVQGTGRSATAFRINMVIVDAGTGDMIARSQSEYEPFILPAAFLTWEEDYEHVDYRDIDLNELTVSVDEAVVQVTLEDFLSDDNDLRRVEYELIRYSSPERSSGPDATPTPTTPAATPTPGGPAPTATTAARPTTTPVVDRLAWLVIVPGEFGLDHGCFVSGPPIMTAGSRTCWGRVTSRIVNATTGETYDGSSPGYLGPIATQSERAALQRLGWAEGWWAVWHELGEFAMGSKRLPEGLAAQLDRPDAPTPTPVPTATPKPTPPGGAAPAPTPTPTPPPPVTPVPREVQVVQLDFGEPVEAPVFEQLLAKVPAIDRTRGYIQMFDNAGTLDLLGLEWPSPPVDAQASDDFFQELVEAAAELGVDRFDAVHPTWPGSMSYLLGEVEWYPHAGFDFWSADRQAAASSAYDRDSDNPYVYDLALGEFDAAGTASALAACSCDQPDLNEYNGHTYYSWGTEGVEQQNRRFAPPLYDSHGRGPRVLVQDGEAMWSLRDDALRDYIDLLNGSAPSFADSDGYIDAVRRLASMGFISDITFMAGNMGLDEVAARTTSSGDTFRQRLESVPLLERFALVAQANGFDGDRTFQGLVIVHEDPAVAARNADTLLERLRAFYADEVERVEVEVDGRYLLVRAYPFHDYVSLLQPYNGLLIVHE
jgi:hypothetical protein